MDDKFPRPGAGLWFQWTLANTVGWIVGMALATLLGLLIDPLTTGAMHIVGWGIGGMVVGLTFAVNQWFIFRPMHAQTVGAIANRWVPATILGWGAALAVVIGMDAGTRLGFTISGAVIGMAVGIAQWFVLRLQTRFAEWWGLGNTLAWVAGLAMMDLIGEIPGFVLAGTISGALTGAVLVWLLRNPLETVKSKGVAPASGGNDPGG